ncbi:MAG: glycosyltransferase [Actinobacteria bacterium]|nr:glycosyltransferase [Actinomycetota bacterium]
MSLETRAEGRRPVELSLVLPAYAEAENLRELLPELVAVVRAITAHFEILVIDTQEPRDDTPAICEALGVRRVPRVGGDEYGNAIRTGIDASRGTWVVIMDVDGSHDPKFINELWRRRVDADVVIASRYAHGGSTDNPFLLVLSSHILNSVFALVLRIPVHDVSNSFRLYHGDELRSLRLTSAHFDIQEEMLARLLWAADRPATVLEIPFRFRQRSHGESKRSMVVFIAAFVGAMGRLWVLKGKMMGGRP